MSTRSPEPKQPVQHSLYAVWVRVDDSIGWRIVHESNRENVCVAMAVSHVLFKYPVLTVEVRELDESLPSIKLYEYPGELA